MLGRTGDHRTTHRPPVSKIRISIGPALKFHYHQFYFLINYGLMFDWIVILPPIVAIVIALWRKEVVISLLAALFLSEWLIASFNPGLAFTRLLERVVAVFESPSNT